MRIGIEHEFFIRSASGYPTIGELYAFARESVACGGSSATQSGVLFTVSTTIGEVAIKPDAYSHILEVVFPPVGCLSRWQEAFDETMAVIERTLERVKLSKCSGAIDFPVNERCLIPFAATAEQKNRLDAIVRRALPKQPLSTLHAHAAVCATQFHFDVDAQEFFRILPGLYRFQYLIPLGYSNSETDKLHSMRPLILRDSFSAPEWYYGYPKAIPGTILDHDNLMRSTNGRDYSFVAMHRLGTAEFRSCDSQKNGADIAQVAALQACITLESLTCRANVIDLSDSEQLFWRSCESGVVDHTVLLNDLALLEAKLRELPITTRCHAVEALSRLSVCR